MEYTSHNITMDRIKLHEESGGGFDNPLTTRYASRSMSKKFSSHHRQHTWRKLWVLLAECEQELGAPISQEQIQELQSTLGAIDLNKIQQHEAKLKHDVMAAIHAWGEQAPLARPIIHLGATSCFVTDNGDLLIYRDALTLVRGRLLDVITHLAKIADHFKKIPTLGYTHFQPAQPTTVGKRATLWIHDLLLDLEDLDHVLATTPIRGLKGATGTQASFVELFGGDKKKAQQLEDLFCKKLGLPAVPVSGQTASRKFEDRVHQVLCGIASSASKFANDIRLLQHMKEIEEPFGKDQVGSSAMPYKRNPMRSERIVSLARFVTGLLPSSYQTSSSQWLERTLDDSAHRRLTTPQGFLAVDGILLLCQSVASGLVVHEKQILTNLNRELPFLSAEILLMEATRRGGDRQILHEKFRVASLQTLEEMETGMPNNLLSRLAQDPAWGMTLNQLEGLLDPERMVGRAVEQTEIFLEQHVHPKLKGHHLLPDEQPLV